MVEMEAIHDLPIFIVAGLLLNLTPGPDMLYVVGTSTAKGTRAGLLAALGIGGGCLVHVALAAFGVSALIAAWPWACDLVKYLGAGYLVYAGVALLRRRRAGSAVDTAVPPAERVFLQGLLVNVLNPKVALFFLAFLPQFIDASSPGKTAAFVLLGLWFTLSGTLVNAAVAWGAGWLRRRVAAGGGWLDKVVGGLFIALGVLLAISGRP